MPIRALLTRCLRTRWVRLTAQLCGILLAGFLFVYLTFRVLAYGEEHPLPDRHVVLSALFTAIVFWAVVAEFRRSGRDWRFWLSAAALSACHGAAYAAAWTVGVRWPAIVYAVVYLAEMAVALRDP